MNLSRVFLLAAWLTTIASTASAQSVLPETGLSNSTLLIGFAIGVISLSPGLLIAFTCFPYFVIVFSILRQAIGLQQAPPNMLIVSLSLFATYFVMEPVFQDSWDLGSAHIANPEFSFTTLFETIFPPFREFMAGRIDERVFGILLDAQTQGADGVTVDEARLSVLVPAFLLSEISRAFEVGFLAFLPFLIIDLVVSAVLMSMGMMMVPPAIVALPFKLAFFSLVDGWALVAGGVLSSYL